MDYSISLAQKSDELALKRLFLNSFDDTLGFVNMFFSHHFVPENTVAVYKEESIIGQAHMLECSVDGQVCYYVYGVCVDAAHRGEGIGRAILEFIKRECEKRQAGALLYPQDETLFPFYEKCGFYPCGIIKSMTIIPSAEPAVLTQVTAAEYKNIRDERFSGKRLLVWDTPSVEYALSQETFFGFSAYKTDKGDIVLCGAYEGESIVRETTASGEELNRVAAAVAKKFPAESVSFLLPDDDGSGRVCGYGFGVPQNIYMNLLLD